MLYVIAVFVTVAANSSILATETAATGESLLSVHRLILIVACSAACLVVIVTTLAVIATQRQTRRRRDRQTNGTYAVNVRLQQSPAASATPSTAATAAANDNWAFLYDVNALPGYASLPYNSDQSTALTHNSNFIPVHLLPAHPVDQLDNGSLQAIKWRPDRMDWHISFDYNRVKIPRPTVVRGEGGAYLSTTQIPRLYTM